VNPTPTLCKCPSYRFGLISLEEPTATVSLLVSKQSVGHHMLIHPSRNKGQVSTAMQVVEDLHASGPHLGVSPARVAEYVGKVRHLFVLGRISSKPARFGPTKEFRHASPEFTPINSIPGVRLSEAID
jgi:hypothetical protein